MHTSIYIYIYIHTYIVIEGVREGAERVQGGPEGARGARRLAGEFLFLNFLLLLFFFFLLLCLLTYSYYDYYYYYYQH